MSPSFPFDFEGEMLDLIVSTTDHCLSFYFSSQTPVFFLFGCAIKV